MEDHGRAINIYPKNRKHVDKYVYIYTIHIHMEHLAVGPRLTAFCSLDLECTFTAATVSATVSHDAMMSHGRRQTRLTALDIVAFMLRDPVDFRRVRVTESQSEGRSSKTMSAASKGSLIKKKYQDISYDILVISSEVNQICGFLMFSSEFDRFSPDIGYLVHHVPKGWTPKRSADPDEDPKQFCKMEPHELECAGLIKQGFIVVYYYLNNLR